MSETEVSNALSVLPDFVPARMVNEFSYCQRLFHLEWVQGQFEHNADTIEGKWRHRAVDTQTGRAPTPFEGDVIRATSVQLGSERLGLIAVIDVLEGTDGGVQPVDFKKSAAPAHGPAWEPELVQLCVQGLLLREHGYTCDSGVLYFASSNERRRVEFDDAPQLLPDFVAQRLLEPGCGRVRHVTASPRPAGGASGAAWTVLQPRVALRCRRYRPVAMPVRRWCERPSLWLR